MKSSATRAQWLGGWIAFATVIVSGQESAINGSVASPSPADVAAMQVAPGIVRFEKTSTKVISHQPEYYHGWPTVAARRDGSLALIYSGGRDYHVCPFGRIDTMTSTDGGETWSWPRTIMDSLTDDRDSGLLETKRGVLIATFFTSVAYQQHLNAPERLLAKVYGGTLDRTLARWRTAEIGATQAERKADVGYWLMRSTDGGRTWSARTAAPGYCPHGPISLRDGRVFYAAADGKKAAAWASTDDGLTWTHLADLPTRAGELHSVEAGDGTLIVHVRDKVQTATGTAQRTLQTESRDGGRTWSAQRFVAHGYPSHLVRLQDDTLISTYGSRTAPFGIRAKLSRDHGRSWSAEFILTDDAANWDHGYPSTAQLADGSLVTVWYEAAADSHLAGLRQTKWRLDPR
ncbi:sialidase family protein [Horticoccus sp. 23ND18S-11]|uniref:sialidase family protein n=1 Tax=Horticoccus sp. 23ND18S-11 TaxID=3391832 RepID=UPI0039C99777